jgi:hypothetical protein
MKRRILRTLLLATVCLGLLAVASPAALAEGEEGETVEEIRKRIQEEEAKAKEEEEKQEEEEEKEEKEDEYNGCSLLADIFGALFNSQSGSSGGDDSRGGGRRSGSGAAGAFFWRPVPLGYSRWGYFSLAMDGAWLLQNRWSAAGRLTLNVQALHLHAFTQDLFDPTGHVLCYGVNAGVNFTRERVIVNLFAGAFGTDLTSTALLGFGGEARVFFPPNCVLELYSLNAVYYSLQFNFLSLVLLFEPKRVSLGAGFNLDNYAGSLLLGPTVRLSFRL